MRTKIHVREDAETPSQIRMRNRTEISMRHLREEIQAQVESKGSLRFE